MGLFLQSDRIALRTIDRADLKELSNLMTDREVGELTGEIFPMTEKEMEEFYETCQSTDSRIFLLIVDKATNKIIGETGFLRLLAPWRTSDFSLVIWDRNYWNAGYGKETAKLILDYGFNSLNLNRLAIGVVGFNERGLKFWSSIGFKEEGKQIDGYFCRGEYSDFIMMSLFKKDYMANKSLSVKTIEIEAPEEKNQICSEIINALPDWFGIPEANLAYSKQVENETFIAIEQDSHYCGFISAKKHNVKSAEITVMGIKIDSHRQGFGRVLVQKMEALLKSEGVEYMSVKTLADTRECPSYEKTRQFYKGMGFAELEVIPEIWGEDNPCLLMVKKL